MDLDETDRTILTALQTNARISFSEIAERIDMSSATVHSRVNKLEEAGVIEGYHAKVNAPAVGYEISAIIGLRIEQGQKPSSFAELEEIPEVREVHLTTGSWDIFIRVIAESAVALRELMFEEVSQLEGFARSQMMIILETPYETEEVPIDEVQS